MTESAWRKQLQPASFRGVAFHVKGADSEVGRRTVLHEYPQRDEPFSEDMGRKARGFKVEAIVIGPDYFKARDALIEALEAKGSGVLVHPYYGRRTVALASPARISESPDEGGMARFSLDFVEAGENVQPSARPDTQSLVESAVGDARSSIAEDFASLFSVEGMPEFVELSALDVANDVMASLDSVRRGMIPDLSIVSDYVSASLGVSSSLGSLIRLPADLASSFIGLFSGLSGIGRSPLASFMALRSLFGYGRHANAANGYGGNYGGIYSTYGTTLPSVPLTTPSRIQQAANQEALAALTRRAAVIEAAQASSAIRFDSYNQAAAIRDELAERLDIEAEAASEPVYAALAALRVAVVRDITTRGADLARVSESSLPATLPALVASYRIYGDATRDADLVSRNAGVVRHPGFVPGGRPLEILVG